MTKNPILFLPSLLLGFGILAASLTDRFPNAKQEHLAEVEKSLPEKAPVKAKKDRKVLIFTKTNGFRHSSIPVGAAALTLLGEKTGAYQATHTEDDSFFEPEKLKEFDGVIFLNTTNDVFQPKEIPGDPEQKKAVLEREERLKASLVNFVKEGGALIGMHAATDTYRDWKEFNDMMGGSFAGHPWNAGDHVFIRNLDPEHPINQAFEGKDFDLKDEIYQFRKGTGDPDDRRVLLSLDGREGKTDLKRGNREDGFYAISWVRTYGKGRNFYSSLGHREDIFYNPQILKHYLAGIQYALGDLEADATPIPVKK